MSERKNVHLCIYDKLCFIVLIITELVLGTNCEPGTVQVSSNALFNVMSTQRLCGGQQYNPSLHIRKLRLKKVVPLAHDHLA